MDLLIYLNMTERLGEREMLWELELTAFLSPPKLSHVSI